MKLGVTKSSLLAKLLLAAVVAAPAAGFAQKMDDFDFYASNLNVLQYKEVQAEIKVTQAQRAKLNKHADWFNAQSKKLQESVKAADTSKRSALQDQMTSLLRQMKERCFKELTAAQLRRVRELSLQSAGPAALLDERVAQRAGVSTSQLKTLRDTFSANSQKASALQEKTFRPIMAKYEKMKPKNDAERQKLAKQMEAEMKAAGQKINPQVAKFANETRAAMDKALTQKQKDAFKALLGKSFAGGPVKK